MSVQLVKIQPSLLTGSRPPIDIVKDSCWMAGGAVRRWFRDEKLSDVDLFFKDESSLQAYVKATKIPAINDNSRCVTLSDGQVIVQCIHVNYYDSIENLLDSFDFSVCQFAYDGENVWATPEALITVLRGHLAVHTIRPEWAVDSLRRAFKYAKKGFFPCMGSIQQIANSLSGLTQEQIKQAVEISPGGGLRTISID